MNARKWTRLIGALTFLLVTNLVPASARQRISVELETSQLSVVNDVAEATFKIIVTNEEEAALTGVWLVFDDGFEVSVGDVGPGPEASGFSDSATRTFDLSQHIRSLNIPLPATLKYSADGQAVERAVTVVLRLQEEGR